MPGDFAEYRAVLAKIDGKFTEIEGKHSGRMVCRAGCHGCCLPGLGVSRLERDFIASWLSDHPGALNDIAIPPVGRGLVPRRDTMAGDKPPPYSEPAVGQPEDHCSFLDIQGRCAIYDARPAICRSHGAPIRVRREGAAAPDLDVCPLNFVDVPLTSLDAGEWIDVDTLNLLLFVVGRRYAPEDNGARYPLTPAGILGADLAHPCGDSSVVRR